VELPPGKTWADVEDWYVKWDTFHFKIKGEDKYREESLHSSTDNVDWKRPSYVSIHPTGENGYCDYNEEFDSLEN
jgi:hypothetical protein